MPPSCDVMARGPQEHSELDLPARSHDALRISKRTQNSMYTYRIAAPRTSRRRLATSPGLPLKVISMHIIPVRPLPGNIMIRIGSAIAAVSMAAVSMGVCLGSTAFADAPPCPQIKIIVPFSAGGASDLTARLVAEPLGKALKK